MQFSPFFFWVSIFSFLTLSKVVFCHSQESLLYLHVRSPLIGFILFYPSRLSKRSVQIKNMYIYRYIYIWDFLHFFITSSSLLAIANTNIMDNDAWLANVRSESQTLFRSGSVIRFLVFRILELFFWL